MPEQGKLIVIEGPDGSGSTTIAQMVNDWLNRSGISSYYSREPGGTPVAEAIREIVIRPDFDPKAITQVALYCAARHEHVELHLKPTLAKGIQVVTDRFTPSTLAYQAGMEGADFEQTFLFDQICRAGLEPDITIVLLACRESIEARLAGREATRQDQKPIDWHMQLRDQYLALSQRFDWPVVLSDTSEDETLENVLPHIRNLFGIFK